MHKPSLGSCEVPHKIWSYRFCRFDVYWIQTDRQINRQATYIIYLQIDRCTLQYSGATRGKGRTEFRPSLSKFCPPLALPPYWNPASSMIMIVDHLLSSLAKEEKYQNIIWIMVRRNIVKHSRNYLLLRTAQTYD